MTHKQPQRRVGEAKSEIVAAIPAACSDELAAVELLESLRWDDQPVCPRCGDFNVTPMLGKDGTRNARFLWRCYGCKSMKRHEQFSWRIGTPAEDSRIPARCWVYAYWRATTSKKGVAALEIQRQTGLSYKSSLFLLARIRHAMAKENAGPRMTGTVEVDETYVGGKPRRPHRAQGAQFKRGRGTTKTPVMGIVQRDGDLRLTVPHEKVTASNVRTFLATHADPSARLMTDESNLYWGAGKAFASHEKVCHSEYEYARGDVTTNTIEGAFSLLKRGLYGIWHSVSTEHLHRYCGEVAFRYNHRRDEDGERMRAAVQVGEGRHLTYRPVPRAAAGSDA